MSLSVYLLYTVANCSKTNLNYFGNPVNSKDFLFKVKIFLSFRILFFDVAGKWPLCDRTGGIFWLFFRIALNNYLNLEALLNPQKSQKNFFKIFFVCLA
jgi:hypothetical protein